MSVVSLPNIAAPFSAFRSIPSRATDDMLDKDRLVPIDATLIPNDLMQSFAIPLLSFDQREAPVTGAVLQPPFELPLAFSGPEHPRRIAQVEEPAIAADESPAAQHFHPIEAIVVANSSGADNTKPLHKPRVVWTDELHQRFLRAIDAAGSDEAAVPTVILKLMNVSGLSRDNVASHLQKHRLGLKRGKSRKRRLSAMQGPRSKQGKGSDGMMTLTSLDQELMEQDGTQAGAAADAEEQAEGIAKSCEASKTASEMPQNGRSREGDGNDCEGSNGRDDCDANEGPASDDGAGAGSDNRTACNVSGMDQGGEMAPHGSHAGEGHSPGAGEGHRVADETGLSACPLKADGALGSSGDGSQEQKNAEASPFHSRSGSNLASKQQITSNGASGVNGSGSEPTEGSRVNGAGQSTGKGATPPMSHAHLTRHAATGDQMAAMISTSMPPASAGQSLATQSSGARRSGGMTFGEMLPVGIPIQLPCDIQVPAGNTKRICAPKTGDGSWPA